MLNDCCRYLICHDVLSALEEETSETAVVYIEPNVGGIKVEDSADEGDGGLVDNLSGNQLNAVAEGVLRDGRSINNWCVESETVSNEELQTPRWVCDGLLPSTNEFFPESKYSSYRSISTVELFEKLFDEEALELIASQTILYTTSKGDIGFTVTVEEICVFLGVLIVSGICAVPSKRYYWRNSRLTRKESVYNAMQRNRFEKIIQKIHFVDNTNLDLSDKYAKLRPLLRLLGDRFEKHLNSRKKLLRFIWWVTVFHLSVLGHQVNSPPNFKKHVFWTMYALTERNIIWLRLKIIKVENAQVKIARRRRALNGASNFYLTRNITIRQTVPRGKNVHASAQRDIYVTGLYS